MSPWGRPSRLDPRKGGGLGGLGSGSEARPGARTGPCHQSQDPKPQHPAASAAEARDGPLAWTGWAIPRSSLDKGPCQSENATGRDRTSGTPRLGARRARGRGNNDGRMRYPMEGKSFVFAEDWQMLEPLRRRGGIWRVASDGSNLRFARRRARVCMCMCVNLPLTWQFISRTIS